MGIVRTVEWSLRVSPQEAGSRIRVALDALGMESEASGWGIRAKSKRSMVRNRWAAEVAIDLAPLGAGTSATCRVEMLGNKHFEVLGDIAEAVGDEAFEDRGVEQAVSRLGKASRIFGRKEIRHARHLLRADETVEALAQGTYGNKQGIVVLTDQRLFFFEKSLGSESLEEFATASITSIEVGKKVTGERLVIHASGNRAEISHVMHGQADDLARAFRAWKSRVATAATPTAAPGIQPNVLDQVRQLGDLRDAGVITTDEFEAKKADLLRRL